MGYVNRYAIAGHRFASLEELHAHLDRWMREVADVRVHGARHDRRAAAARFASDAAAPKPLPSKAPFL